MKTKHKYISQYPIDKDSEKLILGTIHPHDTGEFKTEFFYGNTNALWLILANAFPDELREPITVEGIRDFLSKRKISVSDTILECERLEKSALDQHLTNIKLNEGLIDQIRRSNINEVFFTSGFGKNNAFRLFYEGILGQKITPKIREHRKLFLDKSFFGREVKLTILYSPSGSANISLSKNKTYLANRQKYTSFRPVAEFRIDYYREVFSK